MPHFKKGEQSSGTFSMSANRAAAAFINSF